MAKLPEHVPFSMNIKNVELNVQVLTTTLEHENSKNEIRHRNRRRQAEKHKYGKKKS